MAVQDYKLWTKDPDAVLDYQIDWGGNWLGSDTIDTSTWTVPSGITKDDESKTTTTTTIWLSGGTVGERYAITCHITTVAGREDDRTFYVKVEER